MVVAVEESHVEPKPYEFGVELLGLGSEHRGIVHVIGPELGATQPGKTIVCGELKSEPNVIVSPEAAACAIASRKLQSFALHELSFVSSIFVTTRVAACPFAAKNK